MTIRKGRSMLSAIVLVVLGALSACAPTGQSKLATDAPDPDIVWTGSSYLLRTTNNSYGNVPTWTSTDLTTWSWVGDALPALPAWARPGWTWAPSSIKTPSGWVLYFSAAVNGKFTLNGEPLKCIGVATRATPSGPFTASPTPLVCDESDGGDIDPSPVQTSSGLMLFYKIDSNADGHPTTIVSRKLTADGQRFAGNPATLLNASTTSWERSIVEGPDAAVVGGRLHLIYSGGAYQTSSYGEGQALCNSASGPCTRNGVMFNDPTAYGYGAGGASLFTTRTGGTALAWHSYKTAKPAPNAPRYLRVAPVSAGQNNTIMAQFGTTPGQAAMTVAPRDVELDVPAGTRVVVPEVHVRF